MSERHVYSCDVCDEEATVPCDVQTPAQIPAGWTQEGTRHYCVDCSALNAAMDGDT